MARLYFLFGGLVRHFNASPKIQLGLLQEILFLKYQLPLYHLIIQYHSHNVPTWCRCWWHRDFFTQRTITGDLIRWKNNLPKWVQQVNGGCWLDGWIQLKIKGEGFSYRIRIQLQCWWLHFPYSECGGGEGCTHIYMTWWLPFSYISLKSYNDGMAEKSFISFPWWHLHKWCC